MCGPEDIENTISKDIQQNPPNSDYGTSNANPYSTTNPPFITILKSVSKRSEPFDEDTPKLLYPKLPYHKRWESYIRKRNEIFNVSSISSTSKSPKCSTKRLRQFYKRRKICHQILVSSIISNPKDMRYYAKVSFLDFDELGLLDTGANVSCVGGELACTDFSKYSNFNKCKTYVKTADGNTQKVLGWLHVEISFKNQKKIMKLFVIPSISHRLILGIDFWTLFNLIPNIIRSIDVVSCTASELPSIPVSKIDEDTNIPIKNETYPLSEAEQGQLKTVIELFPNFERQGLGRTPLIKHSIDVGDAIPIKQRFYPVSPAVEKVMFKEIDRMLELRVIEPSKSAWSSPMRLIIKPNKVRLCLDARKVNSVTKKDAYPLPNIDGIFARLPKANLISKLDLKDAFWQIELDEKSKEYTAFTVPGRPLYQFAVMPFGLCNASQTMSRLMDEIIPPELRHCVFGYLDDLIIVSEDFPTHIETLIRISSQFRRANLTLNITKSKFCVMEVNYLGYVIGHGGIATDSSKIAAITNWPIPRNLKQVRGFLGLASWYRRFILNFSSEVSPISDVVSTKKRFHWTEAAQKAFENIKSLLTSAPVLANPDFSKKFFLQCDASDFGIGAVLFQLDEGGNERPIAFMSKKLNSSQRNYSVTERECLAAVEAIKKFRCYLELQEFEVITDHSSLLWLMKQPDLSGRLARWVFKLQGYKFSISHRKGKENIVPDALSRIPLEELSALDGIVPSVDLESPHFNDEDYQELKGKVKYHASKFPDLKIVDDFVYYRTKHYSGDETQEEQAWKLWIPSNLRQDTITRSHDVPIASHGGMHKTLELLRRHFFWPGMVKDVREYIKKCETCKATKAPNMILKPPMGAHAVSNRPFQRLYIDLLGPYPRSKNGHIGLLIVLDHLTKFHWLSPLKRFTSTLIQNYLEKDIFHVFGVPEVIISDNGSQFRANELNAFFTTYGVQHIYTAFYSPQSNASERVNRSLIAAIRAYLKGDQREWDLKLSFISCALRNSCHQTINCSPYLGVFGFDMITHGSKYKLMKNLELLNEPSVQLSRDDKLHLIREDLKRYIKVAYDKNQAHYNLRTRPQSYNVGQEVFRRNFGQSNVEKSYNAKLAPLFLKAKVREKVGSHYYILEDLQGKLVGTFHAKDIRL